MRKIVAVILVLALVFAVAYQIGIPGVTKYSYCKYQAADGTFFYLPAPNARGFVTCKSVPEATVVGQVITTENLPIKK